jgi:hypothetical protein
VPWTILNAVIVQPNYGGAADGGELRQAAGAVTQRVNEVRAITDGEKVGRQLDALPSGDSMEIDKDTLGMLFPPGEGGCD